MSSTEKTDSVHSTDVEDIELERMEGGGVVPDDADVEEREAPVAEDEEDDEDEDELRGEKKALKKRRAKYKEELKQAKKDERKDLLGTGRWDLEEEERKDVKGTWHFWQGDDWTEEEKAALRSAWKEIGAGSLAGTCAALMNSFAVAAADANADAAHLRADNATGVDHDAFQLLSDGADHTAKGTYALVAATATAGITTLLWGFRTYRSVCVKHAERLRNLNRPASTIRREALENYVNQLDARLATIEEKLAELEEQARAEASQ
jgi:hypothetical protein